MKAIGKVINDKNGNTVPHGINPSAARTLQRGFIVGQFQRLAAGGIRTGQRVQDLFKHHSPILKHYSKIAARHIACL